MTPDQPVVVEEADGTHQWVQSGSALVLVDESIYSLETIHGAAYLFIDSCFVFLDRESDNKILVRLTPRTEIDEAGLIALAGEFCNELLNQALRFKLAKSTARIREYYTAAALRASVATPAIDALLAQLEAEELGEDPLDIMVPWEDKYVDVLGGDGDAK